MGKYNVYYEDKNTQLHLKNGSLLIKKKKLIINIFKRKQRTMDYKHYFKNNTKYIF